MPKGRNQVVISGSATFEGPLPPPAAFASYDQTLPGAAERILKMAEREQSARHELTRIQTESAASGVSAEARARMRGLLFGFLSVIILVAGAAFCASQGETVASGLFAGATLAAVVRAFVGRDGGRGK